MMGFPLYGNWFNVALMIACSMFRFRREAVSQVFEYPSLGAPMDDLAAYLKETWEVGDHGPLLWASNLRILVYQSVHQSCTI